MEELIGQYLIKHVFTAETAGQSGAIGVLLAIVWKLLKKQAQLVQKGQKDWESRIENSIQSIAKQANDLQEDVKIHAHQMNSLRDNLVGALSKLGEHSDRMGKLMTAFAAYVPKTERRVDELEKFKSEVVEISDTLRLVKSRLKKDPGDGK